jgi:hypothetical protein
VNTYKNAPGDDRGTFQKRSPPELQDHDTPKRQDGIKPFSMIRKAYLPPGIYDLECIGWKVNPPSQGLREKLAFSFKTNGTQFDNLTTARYYNIKRNEDNIQHFPPRSDYTREIGRLWPDRDDITPDDLVGETVRCEVVEQTKDRRKKNLKTGIKPTLIKEIIGWPE